MACLGVGSPVWAATQTTVDCGAGADLQTAINAAKPGTTLVISGTCHGTFMIGKKLILKGTSGATLDAQGAGTTVTSSSTVRVASLTVTGGTAVFDVGGGITNYGTMTLAHVTVSGNEASDGAGIQNRGTLTVQRSLVMSNIADGEGGGIYNSGTTTVAQTTITDNNEGGIVSTGTLTVTDSTVDHNRSGPEGGGIDNFGSATIIRSTIANNESWNSSPGGILNWDASSLRIVASTITANVGDDGPGGLENYGTVTITATILAGNTGAGELFDCSGIIGSKGYNRIGTTVDPIGGGFPPPCTFKTKRTDQAGTTPPIDPLLTPLGKHGGPTQTALPRSTSPAVDAIPVGALASDGVTPLCPATGTTDQRGVARPRGSACDIGSVER
jgi:nitrous oxidase accessory protein NosD